MIKQIMVVDDQVETLRLIGIMLERGGFSVLKAEDAHLALGMLKATTPDLFVIDMVLPGMDGIELCRQIRAHPQTAQTPVIIFSRLGDPRSAREALKAGADDHLSKPILHHDLLEKVRRALGLETEGDLTLLQRRCDTAMRTEL